MKHLTAFLTIGLAVIAARNGVAQTTNHSPDGIMGGRGAMGEMKARLLSPTLGSGGGVGQSNLPELFSDRELVLSLGATYTIAEPGGPGRILTTRLTGGRIGASFGAVYFGTRNFGAGFEAGISDLKNPGSLIIDSTTMTLVGRIPVGPVAPYVLAGMGRNFHDGLYNTQAGLGLEWRMSRRASVFGDARFVFQTRPGADAMMMRVGVGFWF